MKWLYYKLYGNVSPEPKRRDFSPVGRRNILLIERQVAGFMKRYWTRMKGVFVTRYLQDNTDELPLFDHISIPEHHCAEFIRLRFRVEDADYEWAFRAFLNEVIEPLEQCVQQPQSLSASCLKGWRFYEGYEARDDLGVRFGDVAHGVDPTEQVVAVMTGFTMLRFYLMDYPEFQPNHDLIHLYFNTMGLLYPRELDALEARAAKVRSFIERTPRD